MQTLYTRFPNGPFGDPALYVWDTRERRALLFDCGDLSRFSTRELLKVTHLFLSHGHMDHLFGFDLLLRVHMGEKKVITVYGPPDISKRLGGKLQGYTWNLSFDHELEFVVIDLDAEHACKRTTHFAAKNQFFPSEVKVEPWNIQHAIFESPSLKLFTTVLDHRTPSMAYGLIQKPHQAVQVSAIEHLGLQTGPWIDLLKKLSLGKKPWQDEIMVKTREGLDILMSTQTLMKEILSEGKPFKLVYATDGAANEENRLKLLELLKNADLFYSETCFLKRDERLADQTKHFTAEFIAKLAEDAQVKKLAPFHFSKRYVGIENTVLDEVKSEFRGKIIAVEQDHLQARF